MTAVKLALFFVSHRLGEAAATNNGSKGIFSKWLSRRKGIEECKEEATGETGWNVHKLMYCGEGVIYKVPWYEKSPFKSNESVDGENYHKRYRKIPCFEWNLTEDGKFCDETHKDKKLTIIETAKMYAGEYQKDSVELFVGKYRAEGALAIVHNVWKRSESGFELTAVLKSHKKEGLSVGNQRQIAEAKRQAKRERDFKNINNLNEIKALAQTLATVQREEKYTMKSKIYDTETTLQEGLLLKRYGYSTLEIQEKQEKFLFWKPMPPLLTCIFLYEVVVKALQPLHNNGEGSIHSDVAMRNILTAIPPEEDKELDHIFHLADFDQVEEISNLLKKDRKLLEVSKDLFEALYIAVQLLVGKYVPRKERSLSNAKSLCEPRNLKKASMPVMMRHLCNNLIDELLKIVGQDTNREDVYGPKFDSIEGIHKIWEAVIKGAIIREATTEQSKNRATAQAYIGRATEEDPAFTNAISSTSKARLWRDYIISNMALDIHNESDPLNLYSHLK